MSDRILSLINLHSNKFSYLTQILPIDASTINTSYKILNSSYESFMLETSPQTLTHFINAILLTNFTNLAHYVPHVHELMVVINKSD